MIFDMKPFDILYNSRLTHRAISVYAYLLYRVNKQKECWPSIRTISKDIKLSISTVKRAISDLKESGYISTEQRFRSNGGKSSLKYKLLK